MQWIERVQSAGMGVFILPDDADDWEADAAWTTAWISDRRVRPEWFVVDHYGLDSRYESKIRPYVRRIMVIDDLENRPHECDLLLDHNDRPDSGYGYEALLPADCRRLLGTRYLLLGSSFEEAARAAGPRTGPVRELLICFGGGDASETVLRALIAIAKLDLPDVRVHFIIGNADKRLDAIFAFAARDPRLQVYRYSTQMAELALHADLAIGAGGMSAWERCYLGLPSLIVSTAENQRKVAVALQEAGCAVDLGSAFQLDPSRLVREVLRFVDHPGLLERMSENCFRLLSHVEGAGRVAAIMTSEV